MKTIISKIFIICIAVTFLFCMLRYVVVVHTITCSVTDTSEPCPNEVVSDLQVLLGNPLLFSNLPTAIESSISTQAYVLNGYNRQLPNTLEVQLHTAEYEFGISTAKRSFTVTTTGNILERPIPSELPTIHMENNSISEHTLPSNEIITIGETALSTLSAINLPYKSIRYVSDQEMKIELQDTPITVIVDPTSAEEQIKSVPLILQSTQVQTIPEKIIELDLRFNLPVIRTSVLTE